MKLKQKGYENISNECVNNDIIPENYWGLEQASTVNKLKDGLLCPNVDLLLDIIKRRIDFDNSNLIKFRATEDFDIHDVRWNFFDINKAINVPNEILQYFSVDGEIRPPRKLKIIKYYIKWALENNISTMEIKSILNAFLSLNEGCIKSNLDYNVFKFTKMHIDNAIFDFFTLFEIDTTRQKISTTLKSKMTVLALFLDQYKIHKSGVGKFFPKIFNEIFHVSSLEKSMKIIESIDDRLLFLRLKDEFRDFGKNMTVNIFIKLSNEKKSAIEICMNDNNLNSLQKRMVFDYIRKLGSSMFNKYSARDLYKAIVLKIKDSGNFLPVYILNKFVDSELSLEDKKEAYLELCTSGKISLSQVQTDVPMKNGNKKTTRKVEQNNSNK